MAVIGASSGGDGRRRGSIGRKEHGVRETEATVEDPGEVDVVGSTGTAVGSVLESACLSAFP